MNQKIKTALASTGKIGIDVLLFLIFFVPFYWMIMTSLKTLGATMKFPPELIIANPQWKNFAEAFRSIPFMKMLVNSIIVTLATLLLQGITVIPAAYAFARFRFFGSRFLFGLTLATMMIPAQLIFLPVFLMLSKMGLINTHLSLILPSATSAFAIFMLRQTFKQVPEELLEAARLDKASEWKILWHIMLPIARPTVVTLMLISFIAVWNDYFWPFVLTTNDDARTLLVGVAGLYRSQTGINYHIAMAGNVMLVIPVLVVFFLAQKQIVKAFTYMGDK